MRAQASWITPPSWRRFRGARRLAAASDFDRCCGDFAPACCSKCVSKIGSIFALDTAAGGEMKDSSLSDGVESIRGAERLHLHLSHIVLRRLLNVDHSTSFTFFLTHRSRCCIETGQDGSPAIAGGGGGGGYLAGIGGGGGHESDRSVN